MQKEIDIAVIIALKEEFETPFHALGLKLSNAIHSDLGTWYEWIIDSQQEGPRRALITFIGAMGPASAIKFTTRFLEHYSPNILVNFGLSGTLSEDVKLGDVIMATLTDLYDDAGAINERAGVTYLQPSGHPIKTEDFKEDADHFSFRFKERYRRWRAACQAERMQLIAPIEADIPSTLLQPDNQMHTGHVACGSVVVKSEAWKNTLLNRDRKYLAVDMESAAIAFAAVGSEGQRNSRLLVVRAISDPADNRKQHLDNLGKSDRGVIRKWALLNGIAFLQEFLPTLPRAPLPRIATSVTRDFPDHNETQLRLLVPEVLESYQRLGSAALQSYNAFFRFFQDIQPSSSLFDHIADMVEGRPQGASTMATVVGYAGTGKSAILSCLYLRQLERFRDSNTRYFPIYVNIRSYPLEDFDSPKAAGNAFAQDITRLFQHASTRGIKNLMLLIDGCDEYYRDPLQSHLDQELSRLVASLLYSDKIVKIVGVGQYEETFLLERKSGMLGWVSKEVLISLKRLPTSSSTLPEVLDTYAMLRGQSNAQHLSSDLLEAIRNYRIQEIDIFILSLLEIAIRHGWNTQESGLGALYYRYCTERIRFLGRDRRMTDSQCDAELRMLTKEVFDFYVRRDLEEPEGRDTEVLMSKYSAIPHQHATMKEFLIAEHIVDRTSKAEIGQDNLLDYIYPYGINRFVKSIINRSADMQRKTLQAIQKLYSEAGLTQRAHLAYILGRLEDRSIRREARTLLREYLSKSLEETPADADSQNSEFRKGLLLQRTIYISLIYLEDHRAAYEYLEKMLNNPAWDDLNRGFHLEYYEDFQQAAAPATMIAYDDLSVRPKNTFEVLFGKLDQDFRSETVRAMTMIDLHTVCSLCINRHMMGKLGEYERNELCSLLDRAVDGSRIKMPSFYRPYLDMARNLLSRPLVSPGVLLSELFNLKSTQRAGWNATRRFEGREVRRKCPNPESVADHTLGCILIGEMFLPERTQDNEYSKPEILRMLLIHDLGEAYEGDKVSFNKTESNMRDENRTMQRIAAAGGLEMFPGVRQWHRAWDDFQHMRGINAQIANDIDLIECYVQLVAYASRQDCDIPDADAWAREIDQTLQTDVGRRVFDVLRHQGAPLLMWYSTGEVAES
jgi:nucleoside phosphorylase/5'-deoxynucleotidase YfbR-like HD superfamily hydrolase